MGEVQITELESEVLSVFVKRKILKDSIIKAVLSDLMLKLEESNDAS